jgi:hypothetical protein
VFASLDLLRLPESTRWNGPVGWTGAVHASGKRCAHALRLGLVQTRRSDSHQELTGIRSWRIATFTASRFSVMARKRLANQ